MCGTAITVKEHDHFEDMYHCPNMECWRFWYPEELGLTPDPTAGYLHLGTQESNQ
jgi:hypothetical protein